MTTLTMPERPVASATDDRAVIATDPDGVIRHLTPAAEQLLGHGSGRLVGRSLLSLHVADELRTRADEVGVTDQLEAVFAGVRAGQVPSERQRWTYVRTDSARVRVNTTVTPVYGGDYEIVAFVVLLEEPQLMTVPPASAEWPARLARRGDDYASSVSHELRTPIAIILGYTEILQSLDAGPLTDAQRVMLEKVERNANRVLEMMQSVLRHYPADTDEVL